MSDKKSNIPLDSEDRKKIRDRKERIQHPYVIKSRSHWDWDIGYDDFILMEKKDEKNNQS